MNEADFQVPRQSATLRVLVEEKLRKAIAVGRFRPGERLIERELCELIGVGRTSVREALRQLEAEGLITSFPHRGPVVSTISLEETRQLYAVRAVLEGFCGRAFAEHGTDAQIASLEVAVREFENAAAHGDHAALIDSKTQFYEALMEGSGNIFIKQMLTGLHNRITQLRVTSMSQPGRLEQSVREIQQICAAIAAHEPGLAETLCKSHVERASIVALKRLTEQKQADET